MIKLYYSPCSRSTGILSLLRMMGKENDVAIETVQIVRYDGTGFIDPRNPHPEGKVPLLEVDGKFIRERGAIMLWLTDHFESPLGRSKDDPERADYLSWLFYYGYVMEPVLYLTYLNLADDPLIKSWCRDQETMFAKLEAIFRDQDFLLGDEFSAVDLLVSAPFQWFPELLEKRDTVKLWFDRCMQAQDTDYIEAFDAEQMTKLGLSAA